MATTYGKLFATSAIAEAYQKFRPTYPKSVSERITSYLKHKNPGPWRLAIDVGCGTGQSTRSLSDHFETVIGCDVSKAQIEEAKKTENLQNVTYQVGNDVSLPAEDNSVDLVTTAQAAHWFDLNKFYKEVDRVLKPNGCLAVYGYGNVQLLNNAKGNELQAVMNEFYYRTLHGFWGEGRKHIENLYADFQLPYIESERDDSMSIELTYTVADFVGYLSSWSAYHNYLKTHPEKTETLTEVLQKFMNVLDVKTSPAETSLHINYPIFLLLGRKPEDSK
ncbi:putative methyltransferase DDB_G0268948 [Glandiceps talaboti]